MSRVHICLVSGQILPNLIPILSDQQASGFILFSGDGTQNKQARRLREILEANDKKFIRKVNAKVSFDYADLFSAAQKLKAQLQQEYSDNTWVINLTCGTKLMSLALHNAFADAKQAELIYVDTQNGAIHHVDEQKIAVPMKDVIDLNTYLAAQHFIVTSNQAADIDNVDYMASRRFLLKDVYMMKHIYKFYNLGQTLNYVASAAVKKAEKAKNDNDVIIQPLEGANGKRIKIKPEVTDAMEIFENAGVFKFDRKKHQLAFANKEAARFVAGGWIEEYAYWCARDAGIKHIGLSVEGYWDKDVTNNEEHKAKNEFDLVLAYRNQLMVIECKAGNLSGKEANGQGIVNKLEALGKNLQGLYGKSVLLSAYHLNKNLHTFEELTDNQKSVKAIVDRLNAYKIDVVTGGGLKQLTSYIKKWMQKCESKIVESPVAIENEPSPVTV